MTQRDIAKDKEMCEHYAGTRHFAEVATYWIAQYEIVERELRKYHNLHDRGYEEHLNLMRDYEAAQAHISDLEAKLASKDPMTLANLPAHDRALKQILGELGS